MAPNTAIPPATDKPTMVPVPTELLLSPLLLVLEGVTEDEDEVLVLSSEEVTVTTVVLGFGAEGDADWLVVELLD